MEVSFENFAGPIPDRPTDGAKTGSQKRAKRKRFPLISEKD